MLAGATLGDRAEGSESTVRGTCPLSANTCATTLPDDRRGGCSEACILSAWGREESVESVPVERRSTGTRISSAPPPAASADRGWSVGAGEAGSNSSGVRWAFAAFVAPPAGPMSSLAPSPTGSGTATGAVVNGPCSWPSDGTSPVLIVSGASDGDATARPSLGRVPRSNAPGIAGGRPFSPTAIACVTAIGAASPLGSSSPLAALTNVSRSSAVC